ncbi:hypothetical protein B0H11DRAFT_2200685 [Mycena galericulata]|nr:hypothetical protein B0H11DRAFT_2200685 [Mycena galericulata]
MNLQVGPDDITPDKDYRHVIKTVRNLLMRKMGINLLGCLITPAVVKQHLRAAGLTKERINSLLNPNDRQHVALGYQLLNELWSLRDPLPSDSPGFSRARRALQTFGKLGYYLVMPYICVTLSLREQLTHLSAAAHLLLILFTGNRAGTSFMANQTFVNVMLMIKNAFFCVAKAKVDIPDSEFFLILLGTNREEKLFGLIRTAVGPDSNVDIYQLNGRASNLTEVSKILALRPDWDRGPKRLHLPAIINANSEVSKKSDHVSPASWVGDVHVSTVGPHGCWKGGRKIAEGLVSEGADILKNCAKIPSFDILSPFGKPLVDVPDHPNAFEPDPELYRPSDSPADSNSAETEPTNSNDTDIDDKIAIDESTRNNNKFSPHIISEGKKVSKATILSNLMQGRSARLSTDRTRRVAGITAFSNSSPSDLITLNGPLGTPSLRIGNPIATLVECEDRLFLAIGQVVNILFGAQATESIPISLLPDGGTKVSYQIPRLSRASIEDDPSTVHDWRWSLSFESTFNDVPGALIHPLNPTISNRISGKPTYLFTSEELITLTATIFSQTPGRHRGIPIFQRTERFPYRYNGKACFLVDDGEWTRGEFKSNAFESENHQKILEHNGAHILFDTSIENSDQPCGLCLRPFPTCTFELSKTAGSVAARQIDWRRSTCINPMKFKMAAAKKSTKHSPCTNHLLPCPMQCGQNIWTYNLDAHFRGSPHNLQMLDSVPRAYQMAPGEMEQMKKIWLSRHDLPKPRNLKKKSTPPLVISAAHSSSNALNLTKAKDQSDDEGSDGKMDSESEGYELEYLDEPSVNHLGPEPLGEADDDEIDQEIDHLVAPGIDYAHLNKSLELDHSERPPSMLPGSGANLAPKPRDSVRVETSATVLSIQDSLDVKMVSAAPLPPSETTTAGITQAGASKRTRVTLDRQKICDCGVEVTQEEKDDPKETIECSKAGCESTWSKFTVVSSGVYRGAGYCTQRMANAPERILHTTIEGCCSAWDEARARAARGRSSGFRRHTTVLGGKTRRDGSIATHTPPPRAYQRILRSPPLRGYAHESDGKSEGRGWSTEATGGASSTQEMHECRRGRSGSGKKKDVVVQYAQIKFEFEGGKRKVYGDSQGAGSSHPSWDGSVQACISMGAPIYFLPWELPCPRYARAEKWILGLLAAHFTGLAEQCLLHRLGIIPAHSAGRKLNTRGAGRPIWQVITGQGEKWILGLQAGHFARPVAQCLLHGLGMIPVHSVG